MSAAAMAKAPMAADASPAAGWAALADPMRRRILAEVVWRPSSATVIARGLPVSRPAVSQHLQVLLRAQLVDVVTRGRERIYRAWPDGLAAMRRELDGFWRQALDTFKEIAEADTEPTGEHR